MKKGLVITGIVIVICGLFTLLFFLLNEENIFSNEFNSNNDKTTYDTVIEYNKEGGLGLYCNIFSDLKKGDSFECTISFEFDASVISNVKEIKASYELDSNLEYIKSYIREGFDEDWILEEDGNNIKLITNRPTGYGEYFYYLNVKVKEIPNDKEFLIKLKDIVVVSEDNSKYSIDDSVVTIKLIENDIVETVNNNYKYEYDEKKSVFNFYKYNVNTQEYQYINKYECVAVNCFPYATQYLSFVDNYTGNMIVVKEVNNKQIFELINYENGVIDSYSNILHGLYVKNEFNHGLPSYLIVKTGTNKTQIISPYSGMVISDITNYELNSNMRYTVPGQRFYSIEKSRIVVSKDNKWGILDYSSNELIVETKYEDIKIFDGYCYAAKENGKWYLYEFKNNIKQIEYGYDEIFYVDAINMVVQDGNYLYIKDLKGNDLIQDKIEILTEYNEFACCATPNGVRITTDGSVLDIYIDTKPDENYNYEVYHYRYDGMKNTLEEIK